MSCWHSQALKVHLFKSCDVNSELPFYLQNGLPLEQNNNNYCQKQVKLLNATNINISLLIIEKGPRDHKFFFRV